VLKKSPESNTNLTLSSNGSDTKRKKPKKHVKFDASAIKSESRLLNRYTQAKISEHLEKQWITKLQSMFSKNLSN